MPRARDSVEVLDSQIFATMELPSTSAWIGQCVRQQTLEWERT